MSDKKKKKEPELEPWEKLAKVFFAVEAWFNSYLEKDDNEGCALRGEIVSAVIGIVEEEKDQLPRSQAIQYLGYLGDDRAIPILRTCLKSESAIERQAAALSMARLAPVLLNQIAGVLRDLEAVTMDSVAYVRGAAIFSRKFIVNHADKVARAQDEKQD